MISLPDAATLCAALNQPLDGKLHDILRDILATAEANGVADLTHVLIVQAGDDEAAIEQELGWSPRTHPLEGLRKTLEWFRPLLGKAR